MPNGHISHAPWSIIRELAFNGQSLNQLARQFGLPVGTVLSRSKREGWGIKELRANQGSLLSKGQKASIAKTAQTVKDAFPAIGSETKLSLAIACKTAAHALSQMNSAQILKHYSALRAITECSDRIFGWSGPQNTKSGAINLALFNTDPVELAKLAESTSKVIDAEPLPPASPDS